MCGHHIGLTTPLAVVGLGARCRRCCIPHLLMGSATSDFGLRSSELRSPPQVPGADCGAGKLPVVWCPRTLVVQVAGATGTVLLACGAPRPASRVARP
jgi:hypothetical protein